MKLKKFFFLTNLRLSVTVKFNKRITLNLILKKKKKKNEVCLQERFKKKEPGKSKPTAILI